MLTNKRVWKKGFLRVIEVATAESSYYPQGEWTRTRNEVRGWTLSLFPQAEIQIFLERVWVSQELQPALGKETCQRADLLRCQRNSPISAPEKSFLLLLPYRGPSAPPTGQNQGSWQRGNVYRVQLQYHIPGKGWIWS